MKTISTSRLLYLSLNNTPHVKGIVPGKIFEYIAAKRPILAIGPTNGDSAKILQTVHNGIICNFGDSKKIKKSIESLFSDYLNSIDIVENNEYQKFSRTELTKQMVGLMDGITSK
jgi:hypothetical protein